MNKASSIRSSIQWISHRGLSQTHNDNTLESFKLSCQAGFSYLETDLHSTYDNHIVLCHDSELGSMSNANGLIEQMTRSELEQIELNKGGKLLFLDQFMLEFKAFNWVFDIKPESARQTMRILTPILNKDKTLLRKIIFLFWSKQEQTLFLKDFPDAVCFPRIEECYRAGITSLLGLALLGKIKEHQIYSITPKFLGLPLLNKRIVQTFHRHNAKVLAYLPNSKKETQQCIIAGVDYILTNEQPLLLR